MTLQKINTRNTVLIVTIVAAAAFRLFSARFPYLLSDFNPVGAMALFGGAYFADKWKAYLVPFFYFVCERHIPELFLQRQVGING